MKNAIRFSALSLFLTATLLLAQDGPLSNGYILAYAGGEYPSEGNGDGGPATNALFSILSGEALDAAGNLYIADFGANRIRKVEASTGIITTVAGNGQQGYSGDGGPATNAELRDPWGIASDAAGNLYIADSANSRVRKVDVSTGIITTVAGNGSGSGYIGDGGPATSAVVGSPIGVTVDTAGNLYIADWWTDTIRKVDASTGIITKVAGGGYPAFSGDGGPATSAGINSPYNLAVDTIGNLYIADTSNLRVRKVDAATGIITTVAGNGNPGDSSGDGGPSSDAGIGQPVGLALDASNNLYITSGGGEDRIRRVDAETGIITTVAGSGFGGPNGNGGLAIDAGLGEIVDVALDDKGNLYIEDTYDSDTTLNQVRIVRPAASTLIVTTTTLSASATTLIYGQTLTLTATVTPASGDTPTGMVTFLSGGTSLGSGTLNSSGVAQLSITPAVGSYSITAIYGGSATDNSSVSSPSIAVTVNGIATSTSLNASATSLKAGQLLTLTATVNPASGATPTGTVTFYNGATSLGSGTLNGSGVAAVTITPAVGSYSITASYGGSATDNSSVSSPPSSVAVNVISTTTSLSAVPTSLTVSQWLTLTATVTLASGGVPSGTVTFYNGTASLGSGTLSDSGVATLTITPAVGSYSITASYGGSMNDAASVSPSIAVTVMAASTTTSLTASPNPAPFGAAVTFTATVSAGSLTPAGSVSFYDGTNLLTTEALASGAATYTTSALNVGTHTITAAYAVTANFMASTSPAVAVVISPAEFSIAASPAAQTVYTGEPATFAITITPGLGFALPVALSCSQLPANTLCKFSPETVPAGGAGAALVVETSAPHAATTVSACAAKAGGAALAGLLLLFIPRRLRRRRNGWPVWVAVLALLAVGSGVAGCGAPGPLSGGTPLGNQSVTVIATATNGSQTLTHAATVTLNVNSLF